MNQREFIRSAVAVVAMLAALLLRAAGTPPTVPAITIPECKSPPALDGMLNDGCWRQATVLEDFHVIDQASRTERCRAWVVRDNRWLYVAFEVKHPATIRNTVYYILYK